MSHVVLQAVRQLICAQHKLILKLHHAAQVTRGPSTREGIRDKIHNMSCQNKQQLNLHASQDAIRLLLQAHGAEVTAKSQQQYFAIALHDAEVFHENLI